MANMLKLVGNLWGYKIGGLATGLHPDYYCVTVGMVSLSEVYLR